MEKDKGCGPHTFWHGKAKCEEKFKPAKVQDFDKRFIK